VPQPALPAAENLSRTASWVGLWTLPWGTGWLGSLSARPIAQQVRARHASLTEAVGRFAETDGGQYCRVAERHRGVGWLCLLASETRLSASSTEPTSALDIAHQVERSLPWSVT